MKPFLIRVFLFACVSIGMMGCSTVDADGVAYKVRIKGVEDRKVKKLVKETSLTFKLRQRPPATMGQLQQRMKKDVSRVETILESRGYYDGTVSIDIVEGQPLPLVHIRALQGEQYRFGRVKITFPGNTDEQLRRIKPRIRRRQHVIAARVFTEQDRIIESMKRMGYPFATLSRRDIEVDEASKTVDLTLAFDSGALAYFGPIKITGLSELKSAYIKRQLPWREGRRYDSRQVRDFETKLLGSGLFGTARVQPGAALAGTNSIPINIAVSERDKRTIRLGVNYSEIGPGSRMFWEHRSLFGGGERFETSLGWTPIETDWQGKLTRTGFLDANQSLVLDVNAAYETPEAYDSRKVIGTALVLRDFTPKIQGGIGVGYKNSLVEQFADKQRYASVFFPLQLILDYRDDRLNPLSGFQVFVKTSHHEEILGQESFLKSYFEGRDYHLWWDRYRVSTALRLTIGSIGGASIDAVPADERFYAGGGGSIRGYEYQAVGPKQDDTPTGGSKLLEFSAELRLQPGSKLGYVLFADGGTVYTDLLKSDEGRSLRYGAGVGLRWFTTLGPLRADIAYPLNPDSTQVERLQFYISLGQAF